MKPDSLAERMTRAVLGLALVASAVVLAAQAGLETAPPAQAATTAVNVGQGGANQFGPDTITISAGDTVHWQWSSGTHNVTSYDESTPGTPDWSTSVVFFNGAGKTFDITFTTPGTYFFYCSLHATRTDADPASPDFSKMVGRVVVQSSATSTPTNTPAATNTVPAGSTNTPTPTITSTATVTKTPTVTFTPSSTSTPAPSATPRPNTVTVSMTNYAFGPKELSVRPGDTVQWVNNSDTPHTTNSDAGAWDSGVVMPGASYSFTFTTAGEFSYHCSFHQSLGQTGKVTAASGGSPTATPSAGASPSPSSTVAQSTAVLGTSAAPAAPVGASNAGSSKPRAPQTVEVTMKEFSFAPQTITITLGDTVRWKNAGTVQHNTTADGGAWASKMLMDPGETFSRTFTSLGTFPYRCTLHGPLGQTGTIVVQAAGSDTGSILPNSGSGGAPIDKWLRVALAAALGTAGLYMTSMALRNQREGA